MDARETTLPELLDAVKARLPASLRARPWALAALGIGAAVAVGLTLRSKLGRSLIVLAAGLIAQQWVEHHADETLGAHDTSATS